MERDSDERSPTPRDRPRRILEWLATLVRTGDETDTVDRLFESCHVADLRLVAATAVVATGLVIGVALLGSILYCYAAVQVGHPAGAAIIKTVIDNGGKHFVGIAGAALGVLGGILAWAFQTGSKRLGVVDLFACEIDTLCRVVTVMNLATRLTDAKYGPVVASHFNSDENYFPILDANSGELQNLSAIVVSDIAAFYTYMKSVRDSFRQATAAQGEHSQAAMSSLVYMLYLALESGRLATKRLVEFEPTRTERIMVTLLSELTAYQYLRAYYLSQLQDGVHAVRSPEELEKEDSNELFSHRLELRGPAYVEEMKEINQRFDAPLKESPKHQTNKVELALQRAKQGPIDPTNYAESQWAKALQTRASLNKRFEELRKNVSLDCKIG
jgi:hypothetical protein